jgi:hypothetical protein
VKGEFQWRPGDELKSLASLPRVIPDPEPPKVIEPRKTAQSYSFKEPVVDSELIKWKPIDEVAARVVAKAPWWAEPPQPEPIFMNEQKMERIAGPQGKIAGSGRVRTKVVLTEDGYTEELLDRHDVAYPATEAQEKRAQEALRKTEELRNRVQEVWDSIAYLLDHVTEPAEQYLNFINATLKTVREQKMALQTETRGLMSALREVREFFLEDKHEEEVRRLTEFVELCERLKRLKDSGFLDTVAETMLRL